MNTDQQFTNIINEIYNKESNYYLIINKLINDENTLLTILSEIMATWCNRKESIIESYNNKWLLYYLITSVKLQYYSKTSSYHKNQRFYSMEFNDTTITTEEEEENNIEEIHTNKIKKIENILNELIVNNKINYFESQVFKMYYSEKTAYRIMEKNIGIDHVTIYQAVKKVKTLIKQSILSDPI